MMLAPILHHCDISRCNRHSCMEALQAFYSKDNFPWKVDIAFCLCKYVCSSGLILKNKNYGNIQLPIKFRLTDLRLIKLKVVLCVS